MALCAALAVHVADEAATGFLSVYNPMAQEIRRRLPLLPLPVFTFPVWLAGLIAAVVLLLWLSRFVFRGARAMVALSYIFVGVMLANGLLHLAGSVYLGRWMPGVYSAPLLVAASVYLFVATHRRGRAFQAAPR